jgi:hypothetical protein
MAAREEGNDRSALGSPPAWRDASGRRMQVLRPAWVGKLAQAEPLRRAVAQREKGGGNPSCTRWQWLQPDQQRHSGQGTDVTRGDGASEAGASPRARGRGDQQWQPQRGARRGRGNNNAGWGGAERQPRGSGRRASGWRPTASMAGHARPWPRQARPTGSSHAHTRCAAESTASSHGEPVTAHTGLTDRDMLSTVFKARIKTNLARFLPHHLNHEKEGTWGYQKELKHDITT